MIRTVLFALLLINFSSNSYGSVKKEIISNFNKIENIIFNFKQTIDEKTEEGICIIKYPKKIYCEYDNLKRKIIVSNGKSLVIKNRSNNQYYLYPLEKTPLLLILDKNILVKKISEIDVKLVNNKYFNFSIKDKDNKVNIFFDRHSLNLLGWQTEDLYQNLVVTYIYNIKKNKKIDEKLFELPKMD